MITFKASFVVLVLAIIVLAFKTIDAIESPAEIYWTTKVGNIPIPKSLKESLQLGSNDQTVKLETNNKHPTKDENELWLYAHPTKVSDENELWLYAHPVKVSDENELWLYAHPENATSLGEDQTNKSQIPKNDRVTYFSIADKSFGVGTKINIYFKKIDNKAKFLPLHIAKSITIASDKLQEILNVLSVNPKSIVAQNIELILRNCEYSGVQDELRYCATSLEGMVDFVTSNLKTERNKYIVLTTQQNDGLSNEYTIQKVQKLGSDAKDNIVCHKINDPFVVYVCHSIKNTNVYHISLVGSDGIQTKAVAVCHKDTSTWNPKHRAFHVLKTKPGGKPICHFTSVDSVAWIPV